MANTAQFVIRRTRIVPGTGAKYVEYLTGRGLHAEFSRPGTSRVGVGVENLKTWRTQKGAQGWMDQRPGWQEAVSKVGTVEVVPA